jgi:hypothetical protein
MDVSPVLVADLQVPEEGKPGERPCDHPAVVSQALLGLDTTAGDDAGLAQGQTEVMAVVTLVGMELVRSATGPAAWMASTVASIIFESCMFAALARTASGMLWASTTGWRFVIRWPRSIGFLPVSWPPGAGTETASCAARSQSMRSAWANSRRPLGTSLAACASTSSRSHTPSRQASTPR